MAKAGRGIGQRLGEGYDKGWTRDRAKVGDEEVKRLVEGEEQRQGEGQSKGWTRERAKG
jgi:hypothetical protein